MTRQSKTAEISLQMPACALIRAPGEPTTKPLYRANGAVVKQTLSNSKPGCVKMIETVTAILSLFSAGILVAHAVDAYRAP